MKSNSKTIDIFPCTVVVDLFPCCADIPGIVSTHVESVVLLEKRKKKPDSYVDLTVDVEDYR